MKASRLALCALALDVDVLLAEAVAAVASLGGMPRGGGALVESSADRMVLTASPRSLAPTAVVVLLEETDAVAELDVRAVMLAVSAASTVSRAFSKAAAVVVELVLSAEAVEEVVLLSVAAARMLEAVLDVEEALEAPGGGPGGGPPASWTSVASPPLVAASASIWLAICASIVAKRLVAPDEPVSTVLVDEVSLLVDEDEAEDVEVSLMRSVAEELDAV